MTRTKRRLIGLTALAALSLGLAAPARAGNLAHERIQLNTNQLVYQAGDEFTFSMDAFPISAEAAYTWFIYILRNETGERRYYPAFQEGQITDILGDTASFGSYVVPWINNFAMLGAGAWNGNSITAPPGGIAPGVTEPGMYSLVVELRDPNGYQILYTTRTQFVLVDAVTPVTGSLTSDTTWVNDNAYLLSGTVFVENGATLTIEPGTVVLGETSTIGTLVIAQGAKINAVGTWASPIILTSDQPQELQGRGQWGGLIINGLAPINVPGGVAIGEGDTGTYGGGDPADSSGALRYVRVQYAGNEFSPDNELNGIAFQGVGTGTSIEYIQVHMNQDDGVEFFGGTANAKYILVTGARDDSLDWTEGWNGKAQFVVVQQHGDEADNGIEADNNANDNNLLPRSAPTIYNLTLIGAPDLSLGPASDDGMLIREGTAGKLRNFIVAGFKEYGINIDHAATVTQAQSGALSFSHGIVFGNALGNFDADATPFTGELKVVDPQIIDPYDVKYPDFRPILYSEGYNALNIELPPDDGFFDTNVWYLGGINPFNDWTLGWTTTRYID